MAPGEGWFTEKGRMTTVSGTLKTHVLYSEDKWYLIYRPAALHSPKYGVLHPCGGDKGGLAQEMIRIDSTTGVGTLTCPKCKERPSDNFFLAWSLREDNDQSGGGNSVADDRAFTKALAAELKKARYSPVLDKIKKKLGGK